MINKNLILDNYEHIKNKNFYAVIFPKTNFIV